MESNTVNWVTSPRGPVGYVARFNISGGLVLFLPGILGVISPVMLPMCCPAPINDHAHKFSYFTEVFNQNTAV